MDKFAGTFYKDVAEMRRTKDTERNPTGFSLHDSYGLSVEHILTDNGEEYCGRPMIHPYKIFLELNDVEHRRTKVAWPRTNGFVERFNGTVLYEFFRKAFRKTLYLSVEELQGNLDERLAFYNAERPLQGYWNRGKRPVETIQMGRQLKEQMTIGAA